MKKRISAFLLAFVMLFTTVAASLGNATVFEADQLVIKLHYNRPDGNYTDWSVWFWAAGADGTDNPFSEENGEMVCTYVVPTGATEVGYIVRTPDWQKDVGEDQFIDVAAYVSGTIHVYVESGVKGYKIVEGDDVAMGTKVTSASYNQDKKQVEVTIVNPKDGVEEALVVKSKAGEVVIEEVTGKLDGITGTYVIKLKEALDLSQKYQVVYGEEECSVTMPDWYSTEEFESQYTYTGDDLGSTWTKEATSFRLWAPTAESVKVLIYGGGSKSNTNLLATVEMTADVNGTWVAKVDGDWNGKFYVYQVTIDGQKTEACDPYAKATGVNGDRAMIIDLDSTDPEGWDKDKNPNADLTINDAIIYELHIRDLGTDESSGIENVGKFLSLTEHGTTTPNGVKTGIDHIKELGITHLHILPMYDYGSVDEMSSNGQFNWGYDPKNYNVPEGSYSTDPYDGAVRVNEAKQMVQSLHNDGISVVMDVVYNHVYDAGSFCFNKIVPGYFSRISATGAYSNGSGCGNDTASERAMVKKYIVDSVLYWTEEYHIDGFRFDLVGLIDTETINEIIEEVHKVRPDVIFYGEGWTMTTNVTKDGYNMTTQTNSQMVPGFSFFNDTIRDALKGSVFENTAKGYVQGAIGNADTIKQCFYGLARWCKTPAQTINYASCHDNNTLWDRLQASRTDASKEDLIKMNNLTAAIYMLSQGTPFIHAGEEMLRTKVNEDGTFNHNSYNASDAVNSIKWATLEDETYMDVVEYYKGLIAFRKAHGALRLTNAEDVAAHITTMKDLPDEVNGFIITGGVNDEKADAICVIFNPNPEAAKVTLPEGNWNIYINGEDAGTTKLGTASGEITVDGITAMVLVQESAGVNIFVIIGALGGIVGVILLTMAFMKKKKTA
ncbi:MAG: type I pullulanase [Agathobacter sp.]|nr:type I pullulanase [Agathobacter sp.]